MSSFLETEDFLVFIEHTNEKRVNAQAVARFLLSHNIYVNTILDVGAGSGDFVRNLLEELPSNDVKRLFLLEPEITLLKAAEDKLQNARNLEVLAFNETIQEFVSEPKANSSFNVVVASYLLPYIQSYSDAILALYKLLSTEGVLCIITPAASSDSTSIRSIFKDRLDRVIRPSIRGEILALARSLDWYCEFETVESSVIIPFDDVLKFFKNPVQGFSATDNVTAKVVKLMALTDNLNLNPQEIDRLENVFRRRRQRDTFRLKLNSAIFYIRKGVPPRARFVASGKTP